MTLRLYDTGTRELRTFTPLVEGRVGMYVCGPTVAALPHVGHLRSAVAFDIARRWLLASGYDVVFLRNVTDIDDKILHDAAHAGIPWWELAERCARAFSAAYDALGVLPPTGEPRATGHIPEMVELTERLIDGGGAYASGGDVYFDVRRDPAYGGLSGQSPDAMRATEKTDPDRPKRDPLDFALWKGAKPGEPAWQTPWGPGRPGWHLECSAMAARYLGASFDIHGGGLDLVFPHHENELAQSRAAGDGFARWWLHHGLVNTRGEKMSKSLGNSTLVSDVLAGTRPQVLRYYLGAPHYRSTLEYSAAGLAEAGAAYGRLESFVRNATDALGGRGEAEAAVLSVGPLAAEAAQQAWHDFAAALDDDLAVPRALGLVHGAVASGNALLGAAQAGNDKAQLAGWLDVVHRMLDVLGLDPIGQWPSAADGELVPVVDALVSVALEARRDARARRDYPGADAIRDRLASAGIVVEDTPGGVRWRLAQR
ncbi:MAG: cysteine--tRNA ligase [Mycobacteriales bacterium]